MKEYFCRTAVVEDLDILNAFEQGIIEVERPYDVYLRPGHIKYYDIQVLIESENAEVIVAVCEDKIIGSAYIKIVQSKAYFKNEEFGYLGFMFVLPEWRGKGVNKMIIDETIAWAKSRNLKELRLDVYSKNEAAIRAYEKVGFDKMLINMHMEI